MAPAAMRTREVPIVTSRRIPSAPEGEPLALRFGEPRATTRGAAGYSRRPSRSWQIARARAPRSPDPRRNSRLRTHEDAKENARTRTHLDSPRCQLRRARFGCRAVRREQDAAHHHARRHGAAYESHGPEARRDEVARRRCREAPDR